MISSLVSSELSRYQTSPQIKRSEGVLSPSLRYSFYAFMFSLPYDVIVPSWLPICLQGNLSIPRITGGTLLLVSLLKIKDFHWELPPNFKVFSAFLLIYMISVIYSDFNPFPFFFPQFQMFVLFIIVYNLFLVESWVRGALLSFSVSCTISSLLLLFGIGVSSDQIEMLHGRISGFGADPNIYSETLIIGALILIGIVYIRTEKYVKSTILLQVSFFAVVLAVVKTGSRGSTLAFLFGVLVFILKKNLFRLTAKKVIFCGATIIFSFWVFNTSPLLFERWGKTFDTGNVSNRDAIALQALDMVKAKPFLGWGGAAREVLSLRMLYEHKLKAAHNMILTMLIHIGIVGSFFYFYAYLMILKNAWRVRNGTERTLPLALFVSMFLMDMSCGGFPDKLHWILFAYILSAGEFVDVSIRKYDNYERK